MSAPSTVSVIVPATTANLGCAFDCAAIAVSLYLRVSATAHEVGSTGTLACAEVREGVIVGAPPFGSKGGDFSVSYRGPNAESIPLDATNLIVKAMQHYAARAKKNLPGARLDVENEIPLGVGLGSSAAAIVAGIVLGAELCGAKLDAAETLRLALEIEGHPDNLAAAVHGGMVVSAVAASAPSAQLGSPGAQVAAAPGARPGTPAGGTGAALNDVLVLKTDVSQALDFVCVVPDVPLPTEKARAVLPAQYSRQDVVANLQRTALLAAAFFSGKDLSPEMFRDRLHQPYRSPLISGIAQCLDFRHDGLAGIFLSGAGSAVMAIANHSAQQIADALVAEFRHAGTGARALLLKADNRGTQVMDKQRVPHPLPLLKL